MRLQVNRNALRVAAGGSGKTASGVGRRVITSRTGRVSTRAAIAARSSAEVVSIQCASSMM